MKGPGEGGALPYMGYMGMCRCEGMGYGFQAVYSRIGYINQSVPNGPPPPPGERSTCRMFNHLVTGCSKAGSCTE